MTVVVTLTSDGMGDATEADFNTWAAFVAERIDNLTEMDVSVETARFGDGGGNKISGIETDAERDNINEALIVLWDEFCNMPEAWPAGGSV